ncbi:MAG: hypothetical protein LBT54_00160, partial [Bifidobacteriaceae bacterium]|nr:hypothetical protein [Bifidobacteriaceae bacterium]
MPVRASKTLRARGAVAVLAVATALSLGACGTGQAGAALVWGQTVITQAELVDGYADLRDHVLGEEYIGDIGPTLIAFFAGFVRENAAALEQAGVVMPSEAEGEAW